MFGGWADLGIYILSMERLEEECVNLEHQIYSPLAGTRFAEVPWYFGFFRE
jgi:hypothetical protein